MDYQWTLRVIKMYYVIANYSGQSFNKDDFYTLYILLRDFVSYRNNLWNEQ